MLVSYSSSNPAAFICESFTVCNSHTPSRVLLQLGSAPFRLYFWKRSEYAPLCSVLVLILWRDKNSHCFPFFLFWTTTTTARSKLQAFCLNVLSHDSPFSASQRLV